MPTDEQNSDSTQVETSSEPEFSPRAFATGTGAVCQFVGIIYIAVAAIYWFASGRLHLPIKDRIDTVAEYFKPENIVFATTTLNVLAGVAGGLALAAFGIGLQGERRTAGIGASVTAGILILVNVTGAVCCIVYGPAWFAAIVFTLVTAVNTIVFLLAVYSTAILKKYPPPPNQSIVDDEWIEEYHQKRRKERGY